MCTPHGCTISSGAQVAVKLPAAQERLAYLKQKLADEHKKFNELKEVRARAS